MKERPFQIKTHRDALRAKGREGRSNKYLGEKGTEPTREKIGAKASGGGEGARREMGMIKKRAGETRAFD